MSTSFSVVTKEKFKPHFVEVPYEDEEEEEEEEKKTYYNDFPQQLGIGYLFFDRFKQKCHPKALKLFCMK